mgnify:CR=1 FL=1
MRWRERGRGEAGVGWTPLPTRRELPALRCRSPGRCPLQHRSASQPRSLSAPDPGARIQRQQCAQREHHDPRMDPRRGLRYQRPGADGGGSGGRAGAHLEHRVLDFAILDAHLQLHDVPARRGADQAGAHAGVVLVKRTNVPRRLVVVDDVLVVRADRRAGEQAREALTFWLSREKSNSAPSSRLLKHE